MRVARPVRRRVHAASLVEAAAPILPIDGVQIHPRIVLQRALEANAAAVILYHNHPSGVAEPSKADENITSRLKDALSLVDVRVLDHFVVGAEDVTSFAERGLL